MQKFIVILVVLGLGYTAWHELGLEQWLLRHDGATEAVLVEAYKNHQSDVQVEGSGEVIRVLPDDNDGSPHQRFILRMSSGQTLLIAHNIALAPRIRNLRKGDIVHFYGEYEWTSQGGVIHWTHDDPQQRHVAGWLRHKGRVYH